MDESEMIERLTRIEANQHNQGKQIEKMLLLLDRMVRVEEKQQAFMRAVDSVEARMNEIESELASWRTARKLLAWSVGIITTCITVTIAVIIERLIG